MSERKKYKTITEEDFAIQYAPLLASKKTDNDIIQFLDISRGSFYKYKKKFEQRLNKIHSGANLVEGSTLAEKHINRALSISDEIIKDALAKGDKEKAFQYAVEEVKIAKTDAEIRRVFGIFVDARQQTVNLVTDMSAEAVKDRLKPYIDVCNRKCPKCGEEFLA